MDVVLFYLCLVLRHLGGTHGCLRLLRDFEHDGHLCISMEVYGENLQAFMKRKGKVKFCIYRVSLFCAVRARFRIRVFGSAILCSAHDEVHRQILGSFLSSPSTHSHMLDDALAGLRAASSGGHWIAACARLRVHAFQANNPHWY